MDVACAERVEVGVGEVADIGRAVDFAPFDAFAIVGFVAADVAEVNGAGYVDDALAAVCKLCHGGNGCCEGEKEYHLFHVSVNVVMNQAVLKSFFYWCKFPVLVSFLTFVVMVRWRHMQIFTTATVHSLVFF